MDSKAATSRNFNTKVWVDSQASHTLPTTISKICQEATTILTTTHNSKLKACQSHTMSHKDGYPSNMFTMSICIGLGYPNLFCIPKKHQLQSKSPINGLLHDKTKKSLQEIRYLNINQNYDNGCLNRYPSQNKNGGQNQQLCLPLQ